MSYSKNYELPSVCVNYFAWRFNDEQALFQDLRDYINHCYESDDMFSHMLDSHFDSMEEFLQFVLDSSDILTYVVIESPAAGKIGYFFEEADLSVVASKAKRIHCKAFPSDSRKLNCQIWSTLNMRDSLEEQASETCH